MTPTIKMYDEHPYGLSFESDVISVVPGKANATLDVILAGTLFFPEEGGQTCDRGEIAGLPVIDVQIHDDVITHTLRLPERMTKAPDGVSREELEQMQASMVSRICQTMEGSSVTGKIDWSHRYSNMQNHSGEHVLSGLLHRLYGYENVGFRLSDNTVTLDTSGQLTDEQILDLECRANKVVWANVPITCEYPDPDILADLEYRSKKAIDGPVRIVTIEGVDACACCAPHVARTGEIGLIKILDVLHEKNDMRLTIVCGARALEQMQEYQRALTDVSHLVKTPRTETPAGTQRLLDEISALKESVKNAQLRYIDTRLAAIDEEERRTAGTDTPDLSAKDIWILEPPMDNLAQRTFMNALCERGYRYVGVFCGDDESGWNYLIGGRGADARIPNNLLRERFNARGGGKPEMVQGSLTANQTELLSVLDSMLE